MTAIHRPELGGAGREVSLFLMIFAGFFSELARLPRRSPIQIPSTLPVESPKRGTPPNPSRSSMLR